MTPTERTIINGLQGGFPVCERPFLAAAEALGLTEDALIEGIRGLLEAGILSRFGPMYHAERLGGALSLVAMRVPAADFERVAALVNAHPEVAHNYAREHAFNLWFVVTATDAAAVQAALDDIGRESGIVPLDLPLVEAFHIDLGFPLRWN